MSLEDKKLELEIKKLEGETGWFKKTVEFLSTLSSLITAIIAIGTLVYAFNNEIIQNLVKKLKNDNSALQAKVGKLNNDVKVLSKEKITIEYEIQKRKVEFNVLKEKYRGEKTKLSIGIAVQKTQLKSVNDKLKFTEDCYSEAQKFIVRFCVYYTPYNDHDYHPNLLVFDKTDEEIASLDLSKIDYEEFLIKYAHFKKELRGFQFYLISSKIREANIGPYKRTDRDETSIYYRQYYCWKGLSKDQKMKLLKQVTFHQS